MPRADVVIALRPARGAVAERADPLGLGVGRGPRSALSRCRPPVRIVSGRLRRKYTSQPTIAGRGQVLPSVLNGEALPARS